jgi:N-acetyl-anhydromuramyl-L-alanine amidase AmpD
MGAGIEINTMKESIKFKINKNTYKIDDSYIYDVDTKKNKIILTDSGRKDNFYLIHQKNNLSIIKQYPTFTITRGGFIYQHYDPQKSTLFYENDELNNTAITIMLENMGALYQTDDNVNFFNKLNEKLFNNNVYKQSWRNFHYFEEYTKIQQEATYFLCKFLCKKYKIINDTIGNNVMAENGSFFNGIITRSNINAECLDLNPSFDFKKLIKYLQS